MRLALLVLSIGLICLMALIRPRVGLYGYIWYALMRPDIMAYVEDAYNFSMALAACTLAGSLLYATKLPRLIQHWITATFLLLNLFFLASTVLAVKYNLANERYVDFLKSMAVVLLIPVLIENRKQLQILLSVIALSVGFVGVKFGAYGILAGGVTYIQGYGGQMSDNNLVGLALAMGLPLCWYVREFWPWFIVKLGFLSVAVLTIAGIVMTNSRGAALSLAAVLLAILARSKHKIMTAVMLTVIAAAPIYMIYDIYIARMQTITNPNEEASAASRFVQYETAWEMWKDYPLLGVGFGGLNFVSLAEKYGGMDSVHVVHNTYLQVLVDSGAPALLIFLILLWGTIWWLGWKSRALGDDRAMAICGYGLQVGLLAFSIGGTFYSSQRFDFPYILIMCAAAWGLIIRAEMEAKDQIGDNSENEPSPGFLATA